MSKSSIKCTINIYLRQQPKLLSHKYTPLFTKEHTRNVVSSLKKKYLHNSVKPNKFKQHPYLNNKPLIKTSRAANPQKSMSREGDSKQVQNALSNKLRLQRMKVEQLKKLSRAKQQQVKKDRSVRSRLQTKQSRRYLQQFQYKHQQSCREREVKLRRKTSQQSFIVETHKQSIEMIKKSSVLRSRSEMKMTKEKYQETQKNHEYEVLRTKTAKMQQKYQLKYQKAFVKNQPFRVDKYPNLASTLAISTKAITSTNIKTNSLPKITHCSKPISVTKQKHNQSNKKAKQIQIKTQPLIQLKTSKQPELIQQGIEKPKQISQEDKKIIEAQPKVEQQSATQKFQTKLADLEVVPLSAENMEINIKST